MLRCNCPGSCPSHLAWLTKGQQADQGTTVKRCYTSQWSQAKNQAKDKNKQRNVDVDCDVCKTVSID
eukprot:4509409-Amphidinium_carterae.1